MARSRLSHGSRSHRLRINYLYANDEEANSRRCLNMNYDSHILKQSTVSARLTLIEQMHHTKYFKTITTDLGPAIKYEIEDVLKPVHRDTIFIFDFGKTFFQDAS